jgi:UDP-GlcNAc:undecaprenyl-phosphate GlcNAc-1-phosphate transferase
MPKFILILFSLLIIFLINKYRSKIAIKTNLIDKPDKIRKLHKKPIPLLGGTMIFSSFVLINLYLIFFQELEKNSLIIFLCCMFCFVLGLIDDIKKISYKYKFLILFIIFYTFVSLDPNLQLNKIYFSTLNKEFHLNHLSIPFTILCLLLLTNAINLIDGIDGLCILISIIFLTWLIYAFQNTESLFIVIVISLIYILRLNIKKKIFLGDSGSLFLGCLIGLNIILNYNLEILKINYSAENIFIVLMLPGLDMLRVFIIRIINKKNPFLPDTIHFHHLLLNRKIKLRNILTIFFVIILTPILINQLLNISQITLILICTFSYFLLIFFTKKNFLNN